MESKNRFGIWMGVFLIGLGVLFMLGQFFNVNVWQYLWPLFLIGVGAAFFAGMASGGRAAGGLAVPGSIFTMFGLIMLFQSLFNAWATWAYAWALLPASVGIGLMIMSYWSGQPDLRPVGKGLLILGLALFLFFGIFFELGALLLGERSLGGIFWPLMLILAGLYILFGRWFFRSAGQVLERGSLRFTPAGDGDKIAAATGLPVESANVTGVRRVNFHGFGNLTIHQSEQESLQVQASNPLRDRIRADVQGDMLDIRVALEWWEWLNPAYWGPQPVRFTLSVRQLDWLKSTGVGETRIPELLTPQLTLEQTGTGKIAIDRLETGSLSVRLSGVGGTEIAGHAGQQDVTISGVGSHDAQRLETKTARITLSGVGSARLWVTDTLEARLSGTGNIEYYGNPQVHQNRSGVGKIQALGAR